ncbi:hypothetical protein HAX54_041622, partial [Datura stramonium]|nr:hypothetical protein [Datura stramonium]
MEEGGLVGWISDCFRQERRKEGGAQGFYGVHRAGDDGRMKSSVRHCVRENCGGGFWGVSSGE